MGPGSIDAGIENQTTRMKTSILYRQRRDPRTDWRKPNCGKRSGWGAGQDTLVMQRILRRYTFVILWCRNRSCRSSSGSLMCVYSIRAEEQNGADGPQSVSSIPSTFCQEQAIRTVSKHTFKRGTKRLCFASGRTKNEARTRHGNA